MPSEIREFVMAQPLFDAHEHLDPIEDQAAIFSSPAGIPGYAGGDVAVARGPLAVDAQLPPEDSDEFARMYFGDWEKARNTGYCQATERMVKIVTGLDFTLENWPAIQAQLQQAVAADPKAWYDEAMQEKAGVKWAIKDSINMPEGAADGLYPDYVRFNYRDDGVLCLPSKGVVHERVGRWQRSIHSLDHLVDGLMESISACLASGKVTSFKIGVAYQRDLKFENATHHDAECAFNRLICYRQGEAHLNEKLSSHMSSGALRPLHDYLTHQYIRRATDERLPIQVHTGYLAGMHNELANNHPIQLTPLFRQYSTTRFDLFHAGWPYHHVMATLGKHYPNVWVNMCWAWTMNPSTMEHALDEFLDAIPYNKIFAFGADTHCPLATYGYAMQARDGIARVLEARLARGAMDLDLAMKVARAIMLENGEAFHGLTE